MKVIETFDQDPGDWQDYDVLLSTFEASLSDTVDSVTSSCDSGITFTAAILANNIVKFWAGYGTSGQTYYVTITLYSAGLRVKRFRVAVKVKE